VAQMDGRESPDRNRRVYQSRCYLHTFLSPLRMCPTAWHDDSTVRAQDIVVSRSTGSWVGRVDQDGPDALGRERSNGRVVHEVAIRP